MFTKAYLDTASFLLAQYSGSEPFHLYLKSFFSDNKKYGSRDRRQITQLCYCWFRAGNALKYLDEKEQFKYALFLCSDEPNGLLEQLDAALNAEAGRTLDEKIRLADERIHFQLQQFFPWNRELSPEIEATLFDRSLLMQPHLYLRLRPAKEDKVKTTLRQHGIPFQEVTTNCLAVSNGAKVDTLLNIDSDAVVQDLNSQKVLDFLKEHYEVLKKFTAWDCCAASGGKSLLLHDTFSNAHITVSDVRDNILHNLRKRFQKAGIKNYRWFVGNAATDAPPAHQKFDVILCDVPCSGSGTWSRTPEQLHYFKTDKIEAYAQLQKQIVQHASHYLKPGGLLLYSTCSVFKKENEDVVQSISETGTLRFLKSCYYKGYTEKADTLFAALFQTL